MADKLIQVLGYLVIVLFIASGVTYIYFQDKVAIRIDHDKSVFYTNIDGKYLISAQQNDRLFKGTSIIDRQLSSIILINYSINGNYIKERNTTFKNGEVISHKWTFDPYAKNIADFPINEQICIYNAKGEFYRYSLDKLIDVPAKSKLTTETRATFGRNIVVNFPNNYAWGWYGYPYGADSFSLQYKLNSNKECFDIKLYDPDPCVGTQIGGAMCGIVPPDQCANSYFEAPPGSGSYTQCVMNPGCTAGSACTVGGELPPPPINLPPWYTDIRANETYANVSDNINFSSIVHDDVLVDKAWFKDNFAGVSSRNYYLAPHTPTYYNSSTGSYTGYNMGPFWVQTASETLTRGCLYVARTLSTATVKMSVSEVNVSQGGTATLKGSSATFSSSIMPTTYTWICKDLPNIALTSGKRYAIYIHATSGGSFNHKIQYKIQAVDPYAQMGQITPSTQVVTYTSYSIYEVPFNLTLVATGGGGGALVTQKIWNVSAKDYSVNITRKVPSTTGTYNYAWCANDTAGLLACYQYNYYVVSGGISDTTYPSGAILTPNNRSSITYILNIHGTASDNIGLKQIYLQYDNMTGSTWQNVTGCNDMPMDSVDCRIDISNVTIYPNGTYKFKIVPCDLANNCNTTTEPKTYTIDNSYPVINNYEITYPTDQISARDGQVIKFMLNITDRTYGMNTTLINPFYINRSILNLTMVSSGNLTANSTNTWRINITVNQSTNANITPFYIYNNATPNRILNFYLIAQVDNDYPTYEKNFIENTNLWNDTYVLFRLNASDNYILRNYTLSINTSGTWANESAKVFLYQPYDYILYNKSGIATGNYSYKWYISDDAGNINESNITGFRIGNKEPIIVITLINPPDLNVSNNNVVNFTYNYTRTQAGNCSLYFDDTEMANIENPKIDVSLGFIRTLNYNTTYHWKIGCWNYYGYYETLERTLTINASTGSTPLANVSIDWIFPTTDINVSQYGLSVVSFQVRCTNADCGLVNVSLDPVSGCDPDTPSCTDTPCNSIYVPDQAGWSFSTNKCIVNYGGAPPNYNEIGNDAYCDTVIGAGTGQCFYFHSMCGDYYKCPSYERKGGAVSAADCTCTDSCYTYCANPNNLVNFSSPFFAGSGGGGGTTSKSGLVSTVAGTTPFFTNGSNPQTFDMLKDDILTVTFWINATGTINSSHKFNGMVTLLANQSLSYNTSFHNITITGNQTSLPPMIRLTIDSVANRSITRYNMSYIDVNVSCVNYVCGNVSISFDPVVIYSDNVTDVFDDAYIYSGTQTLNFGTELVLNAGKVNGTNYDYISMIKFKYNLTGATIRNANMTFYIVSNAFDDITEGSNLTPVYILNEFNWTENTLLYVDKPNSSMIVNGSKRRDFTYGDSGYYTFNVTDLVIQFASTGNTNLTLGLIGYNNWGLPDYNEYFRVRSRHYSDLTKKPVLQIEYTSPSDIKNGLISTTAGAMPFFSNYSTNPVIMNLVQGQTQPIRFWYNATGSAGTTHEFYVFAEQVSDPSVRNETAHWNVTIVAGATPFTLSLVNPSDDKVTITTRNNTYINVTGSNPLSFCNLSWNLTANVSMTIGPTSIYFNKTNLSNGNYSYSVFCNDTSNNRASITSWVNISYFYSSETSNTCTYTSGNWNVNCADNCSVGTINLGGNNFSISGNGKFKGNLTNYKSKKINSTGLCACWTKY